MDVTIISSTIVQSLVQIDGRISVCEQHVDSLGNTYTINYVADAVIDIEPHLEASAAALPEQITTQNTQAEIQSNLKLVLQQGSLAQPIFTWSTLQQNASSLISLYNSSSGADTIMIGDYLNSQTDDVLVSGSGLPQIEIDTFRTNLWTINATSATAIRNSQAQLQALLQQAGG